MKNRIWVCLLLASVFCAVASPKKTPPRIRFRVVNLGVLSGGTNSVPWAMNNLGDVIGSSDTASGVSHAVVFRHGQVFDLGPYNGLSSFDINDSGQYSAPVESSFLNAHDLNLPFRFSNFRTTGINNSGVVSGMLFNEETRQTQSFLYRHGVFTWVPGHLLFLDKLNNRGQAIGYQDQFPGSVRPLVYSNGVTTFVNSSRTRLHGLNDLGDVVGTVFSTDWEGFRHPQAYINFGGQEIKFHGFPRFPESEANAINNRGEVVGFCETKYDPFSPDPADYRAFFYSDGEFHDMNQLVVRRSGVIIQLGDINESGCAVGITRTGRGAFRAVLLKPTLAWQKWRSAHWPSY